MIQEEDERKVKDKNGPAVSVGKGSRQRFLFAESLFWQTANIEHNFYSVRWYYCPFCWWGNHWKLIKLLHFTFLLEKKKELEVNRLKQNSKSVEKDLCGFSSSASEPIYSELDLTVACMGPTLQLHLLNWCLINRELCL